MSLYIQCLDCDKYHMGLVKYGHKCQLGELITDKESILKPTFQEYIERKFPEFKGLMLSIGLFLCPQFKRLKRDNEVDQKVLNVLDKMTTNNTKSVSLSQKEMDIMKKLGLV
jgi:hypothetical protein